MVSTVPAIEERQTGLKLPADLYRRVRIEAASRDVAIKTFVAEVLTQYFERLDKKKAA